MTEAEWLAATEPQPMLNFLGGTVSVRKLRLFAVACCWDAQHPLWEGPASPIAVATASLFADGLALTGELETAQAAVFRQIAYKLEGGEPVWDPTYYASASDIREGIHGCVFYSSNRGAGIPDGPDCDEAAAKVNAAEATYQTKLLRCIFTPPFRTLTFSPFWRTSPVLALAAAMYESRGFAPMPILADALEEAGCDNPDVLAHCRGPGPHVRGCWVVDLILGKERPGFLWRSDPLLPGCIRRREWVLSPPGARARRGPAVSPFPRPNPVILSNC